jgi:hypothetical protein
MTRAEAGAKVAQLILLSLVTASVALSSTVFAERASG